MGEVYDSIESRVRKNTIPQVVRSLTLSEKRYLIEYALKDILQRWNRHQESLVEFRCIVPLGGDDDSGFRSLSDEQQRKRCQQVRHDVEFRDIYDNPSLLYGEGSRRFWNGDIRKGFKKFLRKNGLNFDDWLSRARKESSPGNLDLVEEQWYPGGCFAYSEMRLMQSVNEGVAALVEQVKEDTELRITAELLETEFALGDGKRVTWATATISDHERRIALLSRNAAGNIVKAAMHRRAVDILKKRRKKCLGDINYAKAC